MQNKILHTIGQRAHHFLKASYWRGHGVHSPYVFHLVRDVISTRHRDKMLKHNTRMVRKQIMRNGTRICVESMGAVRRAAQWTTIGALANKTSASEKYGLLLSRLVRDVAPAAILELGTSMGVSTSYMSLAMPGTPVLSVEGNAEVAKAAEANMARAGLTNVRIVNANLDDELENIVAQLPDGKVQFAFVDANHSEEPTLDYFRKLKKHRHEDFCMLIFDDIFWSEGMTRAWNKICQDPEVMTTIELTQFGIAIFRKGCQKEHYAVRW